jgi:hypothetical protein
MKRKFKNIVRQAWSILKYVLGLVAILFTGKFIFDMLYSKKPVKIQMLDLKVKAWRRADNDQDKETVSDPLTPGEIQNELDKIIPGE